MASVVISGDTSGTATLQAQAIAGNPVLTLPTTSGTILAPTGGTLTASQGGTGITSAGSAGNVLTSDGSTWVSQAPAFSWNVSNVSSSSSITSGFTSYSITDNTIMVLGTAYAYMGSNSGASLGVRIKNSAGTTLFTYTLTGANENNGGDAGSGMSARSAWSVAIPSAAIGGTLEFFRVSGSAAVSLTINQAVKSA